MKFEFCNRTKISYTDRYATVRCHSSHDAPPVWATGHFNIGVEVFYFEVMKNIKSSFLTSNWYWMDNWRLSFVFFSLPMRPTLRCNSSGHFVFCVLCLCVCVCQWERRGIRRAAGEVLALLTPHNTGSFEAMKHTSHRIYDVAWCLSLMPSLEAGFSRSAVLQKNRLLDPPLFNLITPLPTLKPAFSSVTDQAKRDPQA